MHATLPAIRAIQRICSAIDVEMPRLKEGDLVGILKSGSYSLTASPLLFLGRPTPENS